jgi:hypothetical protein
MPSYEKDRPVEDYKKGDTLYYKNLNKKISYGKIAGFREELTDYGKSSSFMVEKLTGEVNEVFPRDVVCSYSRKGLKKGRK